VSTIGVVENAEKKYRSAYPITVDISTGMPIIESQSNTQE